MIAIALLLAALPAERTIPPVRYTVLRPAPADAPRPTRGSAVKVRYTGRLTDGTVFDSSVGKTPDGTAIFPLRGLIPGFQSALLTMRKGEERRITIPPEQGYGAGGHRLSGKTLVFDLALVDFAEMPPAAPPAMAELPRP